MADSLQQANDQLHAFALSLPDAYEDFPWGECVIKVNKKIFLFIGMLEDGRLRITLKLPLSAQDVLIFPFAEPTSYNLGKSNWITARFTNDDLLPIEMMQGWISESYRAIAPKSLVKRLDE